MLSNLFSLALRSLLLLATLSGAAHAGSLGISPMRLNFDGMRQVVQVNLLNVGTEAVGIEVEALPWPPEAEGQTARDIAVNPPIATLQPGARMTLRVALTRRPDDKAERAYRLYITELPIARSAENQGVGVRLRMGLPIFVAAAQPKPAALTWKTIADDQGWLIEAYNPGNVHHRVLELRAGAGEGQPLQIAGLPYVLPGATAQFRLPAAAGRRGEPVLLRLKTDSAQTQIDLQLP